MRTADFDYELPQELIAQQPAEPRDASRFMVMRRGQVGVEHRVFRDLPALLRRGDLLVVNDTRVMAARIEGRWADTGGRVEALLLRPRPERGEFAWEAMIRPLKGANTGRVISFGRFTAVVLERLMETGIVAFDRAIDPATIGAVPLPPYIREYEGDTERYQTVYSREARSAAAPTAGLHFTPGLLAQLETMDVRRVAVTLEVGAGTFKPVTVEDPREHQLHEEYVTVPAEAAAAISSARSEGRRVIAVGTTVIRTLEHVARQFDGQVQPYEGWTGLKILPGDPFFVVDGLITNFHLPKSTLLMLVAAFAGYEPVMDAYREAVRERYRFYSFGDAMLLLPGLEQRPEPQQGDRESG